MDRDLLRQWLTSHSPADPREETCVTRTLAVLEDAKDCFSRRCFQPGHVTSSALVVSPDRQQILLVSHRDFGFWLQPGGHLDPVDPDVRSAALRELQEETGVAAVRAPAWAQGILDVDVHEVPEGLKPGEPAHHHFDVRFAFQATTWEARASTDAREVRWFPWEALEKVDTDASVRRAAFRLLERLEG